MGIPSYFSYIVKKHNDILKKFSNSSFNFDNLYLDCNGIIYDSLSKLNNTNNNNLEKELIKLTCEKIKYYIDLIKPNKNILIAFDGIAPVAKLNQQKDRRYKSWYLNQINSSSITNNFNTSSITPGTNFMNNLDLELKEKFKENNIILSTSKEEGEGEHKIFEFIRNNAEKHKKETTVIYGLDADLIMLTLNHLEYCNNLYLFRETPYFIKNLESSLIENENYIIDIPLFAVKLAQDMINKDNISDITKNKLIKDYVFLCFLLGNDFMPHFPSLNIRTNGIDILLNIYNKVNENGKDYLINNNSINWKSLRKIVEILSSIEENLFKEEYKIRKKWENSIKNKYNNNLLNQEEELNNSPLLNRKKEYFINPYEKEWQYRYYITLFDIENDYERKKDICINYLKILEWNFYYYNSDCLDWRFKYEYHYPPLFQDLLEFIPFFESNFLDKKPKNPINWQIQLAYVLPRDSLILLPDLVRDKLLKNLNEYYKLDYEFEWSFCKYFWESHVKYEPICVSELEKLLLG
jgi:5'-3' exonuclease